MCDAMKTTRLTLEKVLSAICFAAAIAFLVAALFGLWRYLCITGICIAVGVMISDGSEEDL